MADLYIKARSYLRALENKTITNQDLADLKADERLQKEFVRLAINTSYVSSHKGDNFFNQLVLSDPEFFSLIGQTPLLNEHIILEAKRKNDKAILDRIALNENNFVSLNFGGFTPEGRKAIYEIVTDLDVISDISNKVGLYLSTQFTLIQNSIYDWWDFKKETRTTISYNTFQDGATNAAILNSLRTSPEFCRWFGGYINLCVNYLLVHNSKTLFTPQVRKWMIEAVSKLKGPRGGYIVPTNYSYLVDNEIVERYVNDEDFARGVWTAGSVQSGFFYHDIIMRKKTLDSTAIAGAAVSTPWAYHRFTSFPESLTLLKRVYQPTNAEMLSWMTGYQNAPVFDDFLSNDDNCLEFLNSVNSGTYITAIGGYLNLPATINITGYATTTNRGDNGFSLVLNARKEIVRALLNKKIPILGAYATFIPHACAAYDGLPVPTLSFSASGFSTIGSYLAYAEAFVYPSFRQFVLNSPIALNSVLSAPGFISSLVTKNGFNEFWDELKPEQRAVLFNHSAHLPQIAGKFISDIPSLREALKQATSITAAQSNAVFTTAMLEAVISDGEALYNFLRFTSVNKASAVNINFGAMNDYYQNWVWAMRKFQKDQFGESHIAPVAGLFKIQHFKDACLEVNTNFSIWFLTYAANLSSVPNTAKTISVVSGQLEYTIPSDGERYVLSNIVSSANYRVLELEDESVGAPIVVDMVSTTYTVFSTTFSNGNVPNTHFSELKIRVKDSGIPSTVTFNCYKI